MRTGIQLDLSITDLLQKIEFFRRILNGDENIWFSGLVKNDGGVGEDC